MRNYSSCGDESTEFLDQSPVSNEDEEERKPSFGLRVIICGLALVALAAGGNKYMANTSEVTTLQMANTDAVSSTGVISSTDTSTGTESDTGSVSSSTSSTDTDSTDTTSNSDTASSTSEVSSTNTVGGLTSKHDRKHDHSKHDHSRHSVNHNSWQAVRPDNWTEPIDGAATELTGLLLDSLRSLGLSKSIGFGHQYDNYMGQNYWEPKTVYNMSDVKNATGKYPMVFGYDFYHLLEGYDWTEHAKWAYLQGAVIEISWWSSNPKDDGGPTSCDGTPITSIMPGGTEHKKWTDQMDTIVKWLNDFVDELGRPIPIIFRLFREPNEPYWWWGQRCATSGEYKAAWNFTQGYIQKRVHNVLWAYSPCKTATDFTAALTTWYPGNHMVDIISIDRYESTPEALRKSIMADCSALVGFCIENGKIAAFGEVGIMNGLQTTLDKTFFESAIMGGMEDPYCQENLAYILMWSNFNSGKYWTPLYSQTTGESFYKYAHHNSSAFLSDESWQKFPYPMTAKDAYLPASD